MQKIEAKIVADSISPQGHRITSMLLTYPRFIHSELMTHRMFSRNSSSSRAIPFERMVKLVEEDPFIPIAWQKNHKGMQGNEYLNEEVLIEGEGANIPSQWLRSKDFAVQQAKRLNECGVTKQLCNRLLEPFMWHTTLITATEFDNFFKLRFPTYSFGKNTDSPKNFKSKKDAIKIFPDWENRNDFFWHSINESQAEIHIQALAESMWDAMNESKPIQLENGQWHIPFGDRFDWDEILRLGINESYKNLFIKIATARAARLSYNNFDGEINYKKDLELHDKLLLDRHMSPFEHCARAMSDDEYYSFVKGKYPMIKGDDGEIVNCELYPQSYTLGKHNYLYGWCNNFRGWIQYRYLVENE